MYNNAVDLAKGTKESFEVVFNLATVKSVSGDGRANVQFYGDSAVSGKTYPYIEGYKPTVNDDVLMIKQGSTYIIAGKISKSAVGDSYYISKAALDAAAYLTQAVADTLYMPISTSLDTNKLKTGNHTFTLSADSSNRYLLPSGNKTFDIGNSNYNMRRIYAEQVLATRFGGAWSPDPTNTSKRTLGWNSDTLVAPSYDNVIELGSQSYRFAKFFAEKITGKWYYNANATGTAVYYLGWDSGSQISPSNTNAVSVGTSSKQLNNVYAKQFYQNGTAISTSDKRKKKTIKDIAKKYIDFFKKLRPVSFLFKDGESGRTHTGFIAQEVEEAAGEAGIDNKDLAFLCIDEDGNYGLRYEELIAIQTKVIQDLITRVEALENIIKEGSKS